MLNKRTFSIEDTQQAKGVALLLLLVHHLFYINEGLYATFEVRGVELVQEVGLFAKLCVGFFVFLSGYGLYRSQLHKKVKLKNFYFKNYYKLYETYWLIWIIFIPIAIFVFGRTFSSVYPTDTLRHLFLNFFGLQYLDIDFGYNPAWWFMTCIMVLYLLYPFLKVCLDKFGGYWVLAILFFSLLSVRISFMGLQPYAPIQEYLLTFVLGMYVAKEDFFVKIYQHTLHNGIKLLLLWSLFVLFTIFRNYLDGKSLVLTDGVLTFLTIQSLFLLKKRSKVLMFMGKHSFNIFLFHTFIYYYFFKDFIYSFYYPPLILLVLTLVCLIISVGIEWLKKIVRLDSLKKRLMTVATFEKDMEF